MFTYLLTGSFGEYFLFHGLAEFFIYIYIYIYIALAWTHRSFLSKILSAFFTRSLGHSVHTYLFIATSVPKLIFFIPISADGKGGYFHFRVLANLAFFLPFPGGSLGLLSLSPGHRMQTSVGFHSDLDLLLWPRGIDQDSYSSLNGHSLAAS